MQIAPGQSLAGSIILNKGISSLFVGRNVVVTVLSKQNNGLVLVSMFGKRLQVETTMELQKGQVLNLKVHSLQPKVVLKPAETTGDVKSFVRSIENIVEGIAGRFTKENIKAFSIEEILKNLITSHNTEKASPQILQSLIEQLNYNTEAIAHLIIPLSDDESRSSAHVVVEKDQDAYDITFHMDTDNLGVIECKARMDNFIDVEIRSSSEDTVDFLRNHIKELYDVLERFGIKRLEVVKKMISSPYMDGVDVLV